MGKAQKMALSKLSQFADLSAVLNKLSSVTDCFLDHIYTRTGIIFILAGCASIFVLKRLLFGSAGKVRNSWNKHYDFIIGELL